MVVLVDDERLSIRQDVARLCGGILQKLDRHSSGCGTDRCKRVRQRGVWRAIDRRNSRGISVGGDALGLRLREEIHIKCICVHGDVKAVLLDLESLADGKGEGVGVSKRRQDLHNTAVFSRGRTGKGVEVRLLAALVGIQGLVVCTQHIVVALLKAGHGASTCNRRIPCGQAGNCAVAGNMDERVIRIIRSGSVRRVLNDEVRALGHIQGQAALVQRDRRPGLRTGLDGQAADDRAIIIDHQDVLLARGLIQRHVFKGQVGTVARAQAAEVAFHGLDRDILELGPGRTAVDGEHLRVLEVAGDRVTIALDGNVAAGNGRKVVGLHVRKQLNGNVADRIRRRNGRLERLKQRIADLGERLVCGEGRHVSRNRGLENAVGSLDRERKGAHGNLQRLADRQLVLAVDVRQKRDDVIFAPARRNRADEGGVVDAVDLRHGMLRADAEGAVGILNERLVRIRQIFVVRALGEGTAGDVDIAGANALNRAVDRAGRNRNTGAANDKHGTGIIGLAGGADRTAGDGDRAVVVAHDRRGLAGAGRFDNSSPGDLHFRCRSGRGFADADLDAGRFIAGNDDLAAGNGRLAAVEGHDADRVVRSNVDLAAGHREGAAADANAAGEVGDRVLDLAAGHEQRAFAIDDKAPYTAVTLDRAALDLGLAVVADRSQVADLDAAIAGDRQIASRFNQDRVVMGAGDGLAVEVESDRTGNRHLRVAQRHVGDQLDLAAGIQRFLQALVAHARRTLAALRDEDRVNDCVVLEFLAVGNQRVFHAGDVSAAGYVADELAAVLNAALLMDADSVKFTAGDGQRHGDLCILVLRNDGVVIRDLAGGHGEARGHRVRPGVHVHAAPAAAADVQVRSRNGRTVDQHAVARSAFDGDVVQRHARCMPGLDAVLGAVGFNRQIGQARAGAEENDLVHPIAALDRLAGALNGDRAVDIQRLAEQNLVRAADQRDRRAELTAVRGRASRSDRFCKGVVLLIANSAILVVNLCNEVDRLDLSVAAGGEIGDLDLDRGELAQFFCRLLGDLLQRSLFGWPFVGRRSFRCLPLLRHSLGGLAFDRELFDLLFGLSRLRRLFRKRIGRECQQQRQQQRQCPPQCMLHAVFHRVGCPMLLSTFFVEDAFSLRRQGFVCRWFPFPVSRRAIGDITANTSTYKILQCQALVNPLRPNFQ